ncbi:hypothetical protein LBMAG53_01140 [Planctomycetota bacterium]|nr:hypothetical protein LBMAG53_01140 [Planctomycetota bacterium]
MLPAGATSGTLTLTAVRDSTASESDEDVLLTFGTPGVGAGYTLGTQVVHKATIIDVVDATLLPLPGKGSATEDASPAQLRLTLNPLSGEDRLVNLTFSSGTATAVDWAGFAEFTLTRLTAGENIDTFTGSATHGTATGAILYQKINHGIGVPATLRLVMVANPNEDTNINIKAGPAAEKTLTFKTNADTSQNDVAIVANHPSQTMENLRAKLEALAIVDELNVSISAMGKATSLPIAAGAEPVQLMIEAVDDSIIESNEVGTFALASGTGYLPVTGSSSVVVTFVSDDVALPVVTLVPAAVPDAIATEGDASDTATFLLKRDSTSANQLNVALTFTGTAADSIDFTAKAGSADVTIASGSATVSILANQTDLVLTITARTDDLDEGDETVVVTVVANSAYTLGSAKTQTTTIKDLGPTITIGPASASVTEGSSAIVTLTSSSTLVVSKTINLTLGGVAPTSRYVLSGASGSGTTRTIAFPSGAKTVDLTLTPDDDAVVEDPMSVTLTVVPGTGYTVGTSKVATITINDNEPTITLSQTTIEILEGTSGTIQLNLSPAPTSSARTIAATLSPLNQMTVAGPGVSGTGALTIAVSAGVSSVPLTFSATDDTTTESDQTVSLVLAAGSGYKLGSASTAATITIPANDPVVNLTKTKDATEGNDVGSFRLQIAPLVKTPFVVGVAFPGPSPTNGVTAQPPTATSGADWIALTGVTLKHVDLNQGITITGSAITGSATTSHHLVTTATGADPVSGIAQAELICLVNPTAGETVKIKDADKDAITGTTIHEVIFTFVSSSASAPATNEVVIVDNHPKQTMENLRAKIAASVLRFDAAPLAALQIAQGIPIPANTLELLIDAEAIDDVIGETAETAGLQLVAGSQYTLVGTNVVTMGITDNEPVVGLTVSATAAATGATEGESAHAAVFDLTFTPVPQQDTVVTLAFGSSSTAATVNTDFALTGRTSASVVSFSANFASLQVPAGSATAALTVMPVDDTLKEGDEILQVFLATPPTGAGYTLGSSTTAAIIIHDNEPTFTLALKKNNAAITGPIDEGDTITAIISAAEAPTKPLVLSMEFTGDASNRNTNVFTLPQAILAADQNGLRSTLTASSTAADLIAWNIDVGSTSTKARLDLVMLHQPNDGDVVNIDDGVSATVATRTFVSTKTSAQQILIGSTIDASLQNLISSLSDVRLVPSVVPGSTNPNVAWGTSLPFPSGKTTTAFTLYLVDDLITNDPDPRTLTVRIADRVPATYTPGFPSTASVTVKDNEPTLSLSMSSTASVTEGATISATITCAPAPKKPFLARLAFTGVDRNSDIATLPMALLTAGSFDSRPLLQVMSSGTDAIAIHRQQTGSATSAEIVALVVLRQPTDRETWTINDGMGTNAVFRFYQTDPGTDADQIQVPIGTTIAATLTSVMSKIPSTLSLTPGAVQWTSDLPLAASSTFTIKVVDDLEVENTETLTVEIKPDPAYRLGIVASDSVDILDNEPTVQITALKALTAEGYVVNQAWHLAFLPKPTQDIVVGLTLSGSATRAGTGRDIALLSQIDLQQKDIGAAGNVQITVEGDPEHTILVQGFSGGSSLTPATGRIILARNPADTAVISLGDKRFAFKKITGTDVVVVPISPSPEDTAIDLMAKINAHLATIMTATGPGIAPSLPIRAYTQSIDLAITAFTDTVDEPNGETVTITIASGTSYRVANAPGDHATVRIFDPLATYAITSEPANPVVRAGEIWSTTIRAEPIGPGPRATEADGKIFTVGSINVVDWIVSYDPVVGANGVITMGLEARPTSGTVGHHPINVEVILLDSTREVIFQTMHQYLMLVVPPPTPAPAGEGKG